MSFPTVIVGSGITGMLTAALLRQRHPEHPIVIVERTAQLGGIYSSFDYGKAGYFDYGMHILYDTGIKEVDTLLHELLPENAWHILEGNRKNIVGIFWNGKLQQHSPYIDLRILPQSKRNECMAGIQAAITNDMPVTEDAAGYFKSHFGMPVANYLCDVIKKFYNTPAEMVSKLAAHHPPMNRVLLFDKERMPDILSSEMLRARIGYPDQLTLPPIRTGNQCGWYPKTFGMIHLIKALEQRLRDQGVQIICNASIERMEQKDGRINTLHLKTSQDPITIKNIDRLYWAAGWKGLADQLGITSDLSRQNEKAVHIHLRFQKPLAMGELYHFYGFDGGYRTYRVTNYVNYCPAAHNELGYPVCIEYWPEPYERPEDYITNALCELQNFGVLSEESTPTFSAMQFVPNYHRLFLLDNLRAIDSTRQKIQSMDIRNLFAIGVLASAEELLQYEVLRDVYRKLQ